MLFALLGSVIDELTVAVSLIVVPAAVPAVTFNTYVIVAAPGARLASVQVRVPTVHVHPTGPVSDTTVVLAGSVSVKLTLVAVLGPALVTSCVYVMLFPACTGIGAAVFVTDRSDDVDTYSFTVALLFAEFGSLVVVELTVSVCASTVPDAMVPGTLTTNVKAVVVVFAARFEPSVQVKEARTQVHPAGPVSETAVVPGGSVSTSLGVTAAAGPAFVTVCVHVMLVPALTGFGLAEFVTLKSACVPDVTAIFAVAVLSAVFESLVVVPTVTVSVMIVPAVVPAFTL